MSITCHGIHRVMLNQHQAHYSHHMHPKRTAAPAWFCTSYVPIRARSGTFLVLYRLHIEKFSP